MTTITNEKQDSLGFQLLMSTLNNYSNRIKTMEDNQKKLAGALQATIDCNTLLKQMIEIQDERIKVQRERINVLDARLFVRSTQSNNR